MFIDDNLMYWIFYVELFFKLTNTSNHNCMHYIVMRLGVMH